MSTTFDDVLLSISFCVLYVFEKGKSVKENMNCQQKPENVNNKRKAYIYGFKDETIMNVGNDNKVCISL